MAFLNKSIEDSLKLIGNKSDTPPKKRGRPKKKVPVPKLSPVRNPKLSPSEKFSPFRTASRPSSPISLQRTPEVEERTIRPETPQTDHEEDLPELNEPEVEDTHETKNVNKDLKEKYFNVCRYIQSENKVLYAVTYDPNGQVVYIELNEEESTSTGGINVTPMDYQDLIEFPFSVKEYFKNKIDGSIYGVVLTRGENMCFLKKLDNGDIEETYLGNQKTETDKISYYCVYKYTDIMEDLSVSLQGISQTYEMIQQYQLISNKEIFKTSMGEIEKLHTYSKDFDKAYRKFTEVILDDWSRFSNVSVDYIDKLNQEGLTEEENGKFYHISSNLFARFKAFNDITTTISDLKSVPETLLTIKNKLKDAIDMFTKEGERIKGKILDTNEIDISL